MQKIKNRLILITLFLLPVYLIKIKYGWMSFNTLELLIGLIFIIWIFNKEKKYFILSTRYSIPVLSITIGLVLSIIVNKNFYTGFGVLKGWFLFPIIFGIIFYNYLKKDESLLNNSLLALFFSGAAIAMIGAVYKFIGIVTYDGRLKIFWDSPNQLAMFLAIPFLIGVVFLLRLNLSKMLKFSLSLGSLLIGLNLYFTFSYGAFLAIAVALFVIFWLKYKEITQRKYLAIFSIILVIFLTWTSFGKYKSIANLGDRSSFASRLAIWKSAGLMIENNPLFGIGPGNFQSKYLEYQKYFPPYLEWSAPQPHNIFLAFWLESGMIGLAGFIILLIYFFRDNKYNNALIYEIKKQTDSSLTGKEYFGSGAIQDLRILLFGIMIYILIHGLVDTTYWRNDLAVVFWVVVSANLYVSRVIKKGQ